MIEIFGFWATITFLVALMVPSIAISILWFVRFCIWQVTEDENKGRDFFKKFYNDDYSGRVELFGRYRILEFPTGIAIVASYFYTVVLFAVAAFKPHGYSISGYVINFLTECGTAAAEMVGWITVIVVAFYILRAILRKGYRLYVTINELLVKL